MWIATLGSRGFDLDQLQSREGHWVNVNLVGKGGRLRTVPVPSWRKELVDAWLRRSGVSDGEVFRPVLKGGMRQPAGVTPNLVWYAVKRCAEQAGINDLAPHDLRRTCARLCRGCGGELEQIQFLLGHASAQTAERYIGSKQKLQDAVNDRLGISGASDTACKGPGAAVSDVGDSVLYQALSRNPNDALIGGGFLEGDFSVRSAG